MKHVATRAGLLCLLLSLLFVACKKNWPGGVSQESGFPPYQSPIKKVNLYLPETGQLYVTRAYTYDENLRLETISITEHLSSSFTTTYKLMYSGQNRLDSLIGTDSMMMPPTIYYNYDAVGLKEITIGKGDSQQGKVDILRPPYPIRWAETPQYVFQPVSFGQILFYIDSAQNVTRQAASIGDYYLEGEWLFSYSNYASPEYGVMKKAYLMEIDHIIPMFNTDYRGIDVVSPKLPEKIKQRIYDTPFEQSGDFSFGTDNHLRVTKAYQKKDGVYKLVRAYEYY
jgi:hypothetical protein